MPWLEIKNDRETVLKKKRKKENGWLSTQPHEVISMPAGFMSPLEHLLYMHRATEVLKQIRFTDVIGRGKCILT